MFQKILIANRGEIACRISRTCRRLGVATVAVHSEADARAQHVLACDEAVAIGPAPVSESYLKADRILQAALNTGAEAIHPGYGFLSENPDFAEAVETAGLSWIGPPAAAIRAMGLKDAAKKLMEKAGVPVTPGYHGERQEPDHLAAMAAEIGYPVLIKASAGGGGKGMRRVDGPKDFAAALKSAKSEAASSFGHDHVLIEKYIQNPRHIEVQVFADAHGNTVHLYERDCSAQRRHQKVIEEAPAPGMTSEVRAAMTGAAVRAAEAVGYRGAGTVEFIVDGSGSLRPDGFWFMEMNTRLQVEHPVTEAITGIDLVEWQLRAAAGEPLPLAQDQIPLNGHALEARIYAEDAARDFMPQTGRLKALEFSAAARVDTGVIAGDEVTPHYDPMIAKLITHGPDRRAAFSRMAAALSESHAEGIVTNIGFLSRLVAHETVTAGHHDTGTIAREIEALTRQTAPDGLIKQAAALAILDLLEPRPETLWRAWGPGKSYVTLAQGDEAPETVTIERTDASGLSFQAAGESFMLRPVGPMQWQLSHARKTRTLRIFLGAESVTIIEDGERYRFDRIDAISSTEIGVASGDQILAPLPGLVKSLDVAAGSLVAKGDPVAVMEAMKMEHTLTAPRDGTIAEVLAGVGDQLAEGAVLVSLEPEEH